MIAARQAFPGDHAAVIQYKIMSEDPQPLSRYNNKATPEIERIVSKMLAKDREVRYQTMSGVAAAMRPSMCSFLRCIAFLWRSALSSLVDTLYSAVG